MGPYARPGDSRGSRGNLLSRALPESWVPLAERGFPVAVQNPRPDLQQQMGATLCPLHLLLFHHTFADHLIHCGLHRVAAIRQERELLVELVLLGVEHLKQAPFGFLVIGLDERKALTGDGLLGRLAPLEGQETFARDDF